MTMASRFNFIAALLGFTGVAAGAFGAHALKATLVAREMTTAWDKAVLYQLVHAVVLLVVNLQPASRGLRAAAWCWIAGVIFFSGSLYGLALGGPRILGPITPLGGLALLAGWAVIAVTACTTKKDAAS